VAGSAADLPPGYGLEWVSSTALLRLPPGAIEKAEDALVAAGVGSRRWWGDGLGAHTAFLRHARTDLSVTETLGATVLGLPCWTLLPEEEIQQAVQLVLSVLPEGRERDR
jgi:dTDP-4-amino-4,6-dideoxygalactose transaminase